MTDIVIPTGYHFGLTARTGAYNCNHDIISMKTYIEPTSKVAHIAPEIPIPEVAMAKPSSYNHQLFEETYSTIVEGTIFKNLHLSYEEDKSFVLEHSLVPPLKEEGDTAFIEYWQPVGNCYLKKIDCISLTTDVNHQKGGIWNKVVRCYMFLKRDTKRLQAPMFFLHLFAAL